MASFSVNINRNEGSIKGSSKTFEKEMLKELKLINASLKGKVGAGGIGRSGFGAGILGGEAISGMFGGGALGTLAKGGFWAMMAAAGLLGAINAEPGGPKKGTIDSLTATTDQWGNVIGGSYVGGGTWEKYVDKNTGAAMVGFFDEKTGKLLETMTKQEAIDDEILDASGELRDKYNVGVSLFDEATEGMERTRDGVLLTADDIEKIQQITADGKVTDEEILELKQKIKEKLAEQLMNLETSPRSSNISYASGGSGYAAPPGDNMSVAPVEGLASYEAEARNDNQKVAMDTVKYKLSFYNSYSVSTIMNGGT